jgi:DNA-binding response OmpR family regulator
MNQYLALIVEDEPDLAHIFAEALKMAGFVTEVVTDGKRALARLKEIVPHVVVLDLHLPGVDGETILRHIREEPGLAGTRIMIASADAVMADALDFAADLVLLKPVGFSQLRDLAERMLMDIRA